MLYLWIALGCWCFNFILSTVRMIYQNLGRCRDSVRMETFVDPADEGIVTAVHITVPVGRAWKFRAGQYAYLWLPTIGLRSWFQSHPYSVAWWDNAHGGDRTISFLVEPQEGLSRRLIRRRFLRFALMDGPYGVDAGLGKFETVLLFAGGIGIAGALPYVRHLIEEYSERRISTRRLSLVWILKEDCKLRQITL